MKKLHIIYVTGLGDRNPRGQRRAVSLWRIYGVEPEFCQMNWGDKGPWQPKFDRLLKMVDDAYDEGKPVGIVGVSAGASAAINAFAARKDKIAGVVLIAGKVNRPETVGESYKRNNKAFVTSVNQSPESLSELDDADRVRILSLYALKDERVAKADSFIPNAHNVWVPSIGHFFTIALQITLGASGFIYFLRKVSKS